MTQLHVGHEDIVISGGREEALLRCIGKTMRLEEDVERSMEG